MSQRRKEGDLEAVPFAGHCPTSAGVGGSSLSLVGDPDPSEGSDVMVSFLRDAFEQEGKGWGEWNERQGETGSPCFLGKVRL